MSGLDFAFGVLFLTMVSILYGATLFVRRRSAGAGPEAERLRTEVETLRERLAVLERIAVEKENSLEREFERLRDR